MPAGSWAEQAKAFEDYIIGLTAAEVANLDLSLVAGCTMQNTAPLFKDLVAEAFASTLKVEFKTSETVTAGVAINTKVSGKKVTADFAGVAIADGKVAAAMVDCSDQSFTISEGAIVAPATPKASKNEQGESYTGMPAGPWYKQAQAFADTAVGKTLAELADLATDGDALTAAGCTMSTDSYKATVIDAVGYAR